MTDPKDRKTWDEIESETLAFYPPAPGSWPAHCEQRAFVEGAKWWEFRSTKGTMWSADVDAAEAEAVARYGPPPMNEE